MFSPIRDVAPRALLPLQANPSRFRSGPRYSPTTQLGGCGVYEVTGRLPGVAVGRVRRVGDVLESATRASERAACLDGPSYRLEHVLALTLTCFGGGSDRVRNVLNGTFMGHPVHPMVASVPLGAWTAAVALDAVDTFSAQPPGYRDAAQLVLGVGVAGSLASAVTGLADWQYTHDETRRSGLVHGIINVAALGLCAVSWRDRRAGHHARARVSSALGYGLSVSSSFLGGTLVFRHQIGVDHSGNELGPPDFLPVLPVNDLPPGQPHKVDADGVGIVLIRDHDHEGNGEGGRIYAVGERCPHLGAPMVDGWLYRGQLVCPWHGSCFDLAEGTATRGPASAPLPTYQVRQHHDQIEVRRRPGVRSQAPSEVSDHEG